MKRTHAATRHWMVCGVLPICVVVACAGPQPQPAQHPASARTTPTAGERHDSLTAERDRVLALRAPRYSGSGEKDDALRFLNGDLQAWVTRRTEATDGLIEKYTTERSAAETSSVQAAHHCDVAELELDYSREFLTSAAGAMPAYMHSDPELEQAYLGALADAVRSRLDSAIRAADACLAADPAGEGRARAEELKRQAMSIGQAQTPVAADPP